MMTLGDRTDLSGVRPALPLATSGAARHALSG